MKARAGAIVGGLFLVAACTGGGNTIIGEPPPVRPDAGGSSSSSSGGTTSSSSSSGGTTFDAGPVPLPTTFDATWVAICTTALALKDPAQALRFWVESAIAPDGTLALQLTPLLGWSNGDYVMPSDASLVNRRKEVIGLAGMLVGNDGRFIGNFGTWNAEASANSISGRAATIENTTFDGKYDASPNGQGFCAQLSGRLVVPYEYDFIGSENICLFRKALASDPMPTIPAADFVCPL